MPNPEDYSYPHYGFSSIDGKFMDNTLNHDSYVAEKMEREGDKRYPRDLEKITEEEKRLYNMEPLRIGESKLVPYSEFCSARRTRISEFRTYFNNQPPTRVLDREDPAAEMTRYIHGVPREVVTKGAKFLFGKGRFDGLESFVFDKGGKSFQQQWADFWYTNKIDTMLPRTARTGLWAGDSFWKFGSKTTVSEKYVPAEEGSGQPPRMKENKEIEVTVNIIDSEHVHAITKRDRPDVVISWVYQFQRDGGKTFYREEIFKDMTFVYEGVLRESVVEQGKARPVQIEGSGLHSAELTAAAEFVEFVLVDIIEYPEFNEFPLIKFVNDPDNDLYGTSLYHGLLGKFDMLNAIFTRSLHAIENQATPLLYITGATETNAHNVHVPDAAWYFQNPDAKVQTLQWEGTPEPVFEFIDRIEEQVFRNAGVPKSSEMKAFTNVSGEALSIINTDIIDTTNERRMYYENSFRDLVRLFRKAMGYSIPIEASMTLKWGSVFPESTDKLAEQLVTLRRENIVGPDYVIRRHPNIPFFEKKALEEEAKQREEEDRKLKEEAIAAQAKRVTQRAGGTTAERGKAKKP